MSVSKKLTLAADGLSATVVDATLTDVLTTMIDTNASLTGIYGFAQKLGFVGIGMVVQNKRLGGGFNPFAA